MSQRQSDYYYAVLVRISKCLGKFNVHPRILELTIRNLSSGRDGTMPLGLLIIPMWMEQTKGINCGDNGAGTGGFRFLAALMITHLKMIRACETCGCIVLRPVSGYWVHHLFLTPYYTVWLNTVKKNCDVSEDVILHPAYFEISFYYPMGTLYLTWLSYLSCYWYHPHNMQLTHTPSYYAKKLIWIVEFSAEVSFFGTLQSGHI